ncbi:hypothetical protein M747DRAFT_322972 [Aspergillus niger ATCC 13496]|uniref:Contig An12c0060, genomic contig n=2 Tax=Aspergillus niger TaxID=5061 RepID=A2QYM7_ASPNC|nr:uncharacterized protein An12g01800 [Aspergillus niger]RDH20723.1 hypothetical protein M747DRAFT_322972 [Aspergillus niger ATCC 13496]CAK48462.1 unnamed protein product [Aspergillus niger]|eukprot:XP_001395266.1 alpha-1,3-glucanase/mutanase [Aspergillus niger CBS 513.88]
MRHSFFPFSPTGSIVILFLLLVSHVRARAVFAHFMISNTEGYTVDDWESEMALAVEAKIDAFALNIAADQDVNTASVANAFLAAENVGFYLFFSFDYAGNGAWAKADVINYINTYKSPDVYFYYNDKPFVSTFEGPGNAEDWVDIKSETGCFFIPDWSSLGAMEAMEQADGVADMDTYTDASYINYLEGKPYMMPVSPWFFTNMPGYDKNWLWRGDGMWFDRWNQALFVAPEFIEIISWNDYGESHYIGPIKSSDDPLANQTYTAFDTGLAPYNYVLDMPHDGWRAFLPYVIETYKNNISTITQEGVTGWYRLNKAGACSSDGGTTGNTANELQIEYWPYEIVQDKIFYSALLGSQADITVSVGGTDLGASWTATPSGDIGIYHGSVSFSSHSGAVTITISRGGATIASIDGQSISSGCAAASDIENWNAWVGSSMSSSTISATPATSLSNETCIEGWGAGNFLGLCSAACSWGYCPITACVCSKLGPPPTVPEETGVDGYPISGEDASYSGLCSFDCNHGYCPSTACGTVEVTLTVPTVSDFAAEACTAGEGTGDFVNLCAFGCAHGYCPIHACNCTATGALDLFSVVNSSATAHLVSGDDDYGLCDFACERDRCYDQCELGESYSESDELSCTDDDTRSWCEVTSPCDYNLTISTMEDLDVESAYMQDECIPYYMLTVLYNLVDEVVANYTEIMADNNYNKTFKYYKEYVENNITSSLASVMEWAPAGPGLSYFDCVIEWKGKNESATSCPNYSATGVFSVYYEVKNSTEFEEMLLEDYGIQPDWFKYGVEKDSYLCDGESILAPSCHDSVVTYYNIPQKADYVNITDPRVVVEKSLPNLDNLQANILAVQLQILLGSWPGFTDDIVQSISLAVELLLQAVSSMQEVVAIGKAEEAWKKKEMIEDIISAIFLVIPFIGEADAISDVFLDVSRVATVVGDTAIVADSIYEIVEDPDNRVATILSTLLLVGQRSAEEYGTMAAARRDIPDETIESLGPVFKEKNTQVENLVKDCAAA